MRVRQYLKSISGRFLQDRTGNFVMAAGVVFPIVLAAAGVGLDLAQMYQAKSNLLNALDAAVTSTARDITTGKIDKKDARQSVEDFLLANGATAFNDVSKLSLDSLIVNPKKRTVEANASVEITTVFPIFSLARERRISTQSAAVYSDRTIEVAMMLDVTGSMGGQKITDLKIAAKNAARIFLEGQNLTDPRVRVAVVPYADAVNVGPLAFTVFAEKKGGPKNPPGLTDPTEVNTAPDTCATERKDGSGTRAAINDDNPYSAKVNRDYRLVYCPTAELLPLTGNLDTVNATINSLDANGYTAGHIGIQWSWYMLSPKWAKVLPASAAPALYGSKSTVKYAILMTDGIFNTAFAGVDDDDDTRGKQKFKSASMAEQICDGMKKKGIEIFTIGFMLTSSSAKDIMRNCASKDTGSVQHYFEAANGASLDAAFSTIAGNIERLAITR